ncbi:nitrate ABC transporter substrate-binding protein [Ellagibacter isourolithinifaciens]|uniref:nitrate ABC transporter substrate-binding protein n=1 Tax=Ellagibacter isourolithinifaciens TaxID=2137581 RepID=UPI003AF01CF8
MTAPETSTCEAAGAQAAVELTAMPAAIEAVEPTEPTEPEFFDSLFRKRKKNGEWKIVETPDLGVLAVDAHCHLQYQKNPGLALARAGLHGVGFMCTVVDVYEDGTTTYDSLSKWNHEAALSMQRLFSRC